MQNVTGGRARSILIIGAGFGGISAALRLRAQGFDNIIIAERGSAPGGVWQANKYPDARCDNPSALYSLADRSFSWSGRFADRAQIQQYLQEVVTSSGLGGRIEYGQQVTSAHFREEHGHWEVRTAQGRVYLADILISAVGQLAEPRLPNLRGIHTFLGDRFHSAEWDAGFVPAGRRVGVIGTGASAAQVIPWLQEHAESVTVYQRSPAWVLPKSEVEYSALRRRLSDTRAVRLVERTTVFLACELLTLSVTTIPVVGRLVSALARARLRNQVPDPELRQALTPDYPLGGKRCLFSDRYYPALASANCTVQTDPIAEITPTGIRTENGAHTPLDAIVYCTGFTPSEFLSTIEVHGRNGTPLTESWRGGTRAYLGMTVPDFPNLFLMAGPNTNLTFGSIIFMLECQARYIAALLAQVDQDDIATIEVRGEAADGFDSWLRRRLDGSVWSRVRNPYRDRAGAVTALWPATMTRYRLLTRRPRIADYLFEAAPRRSRPAVRKAVHTP